MTQRAPEVRFVLETGMLAHVWGFRAGIRGLGGIDIDKLTYVFDIGAASGSKSCFPSMTRCTARITLGVRCDEEPQPFRNCIALGSDCLLPSTTWDFGR